MTIIFTTTRLPFSRLCTCLPFELLLVIKYSAKSYRSHTFPCHRNIYVNQRGKQRRGKLCQRISRSISDNGAADPAWQWKFSNTSMDFDGAEVFSMRKVFFFSPQHRIILAFHCCGLSCYERKKRVS